MPAAVGLDAGWRSVSGVQTPEAPAVPPVLSAGQWEALLFQCPQSVKPLVMQLAVYHGAVERPAPEECPLCGTTVDEQRAPC